MLMEREGGRGEGEVCLPHGARTYAIVPIKLSRLDSVAVCPLTQEVQSHARRGSLEYAMDGDNARPTSFVIADDLVLSSLEQAAALYREARAPGARPPAEPGRDAVLAKLRQAEELYRQFQVRWERQATDLLDAQSRLADLQETNDQLAHALRALRRQLEQEREQAARQRERANHTAALLKEIHRSLFGGNVYELILRACLTITGATRGLYVTARDRDDRLRVRAAIDVDDYPQAPPSPFIEALCRKVLGDQDTLVSGEDGAAALPRPTDEGEHFRNFAAAPVMLLKNPSGVIIAADKLHGDFEEEDVESLLSVGDRSAAAVENRERHRELHGAYLAIVGALAGAMETADPYTDGSGDAAARYARGVAARLGLPEQDRDMACYAALLRDVGKVGVADGVLNKPGSLLPAERELVRSHVRLGVDLLRRVPALREVAAVVLHHHERYDGAGYPAGLRGEAIPLASRIVAVVDAYCAMLAPRSYRERSSEERARAELARGAGTQFDPRVVEAFLAALDAPEAAEWDGEDDGCGTLPGFRSAES